MQKTIADFLNNVNAVHSLRKQSSSSFEDNVYFDKRVYEGDVRKLIPNQGCKFLVGSKMIHGEKVFYATKVLMA